MQLVSTNHCNLRYIIFSISFKKQDIKDIGLSPLPIGFGIKTINTPRQGSGTVPDLNSLLKIATRRFCCGSDNLRMISLLI